MSLVSIRDISFHAGHACLLDAVSFKIDKGDRICLIGRNGAGKSTLLRILQGEVEGESGEILKPQGFKIGTLIQEVPTGMIGQVFEVVLSGMGEQGTLIRKYEQLTSQVDLSEADLQTLYDVQEKIDQTDAWQAQQTVHTVLSKLSLDGGVQFESLSGGLKRRVLLAKVLVSNPDLLLLDEPTNHLDIDSIRWLEHFLPTLNIPLVFITHDRAFLREVATKIIELDRGRLIPFDGGYTAFLKHKEMVLSAEANQNEQFDKKLAQEEVWIRQGIKARRTRNEGRVRALEKMRVERQRRRDVQGNVKLNAQEAEKSGKVVIDAEHITFAYDSKKIIDSFSVRVMRGDRIGILGPNGCGKSTLINVLLGKLKVNSGEIKLGTQLHIAYFDQLRGQLDESKTIVDNIGEGREFVELEGKQIHIFTYLQHFLFTPERAKTPISVLSGGERNRLLFAKLLAKPSNVLVLDEPTNDLDIETLELLEEMLSSYQGTIIMVSHDREFIDQLVTSTIAFEGEGQWREYVGGYQDWLRQKATPGVTTVKGVPPQKEKKQKPKREAKSGLTFTEQHRLKELPVEIENLEEKVQFTQTQMVDPEFYKKPADEIKSVQNSLAELESELESLYALWEALETKQG